MCTVTDLSNYDHLAPLLSKLLPAEPSMKIVGIIGEGFRSIALETESGVLVRIGRRA